jgi:hypothetical protein
MLNFSKLFVWLVKPCCEKLIIKKEVITFSIKLKIQPCRRQAELALEN